MFPARPLDFDGDGRADIATYHEPTGDWSVKGSKDGPLAATLGGLGKLPAVGDYDGDGRVDMAVYEPTTGAWSIRRSSDQQVEQASFGAGAGSVPVPADYDGDGRADLAVWEPGPAIWHIKPSGGGAQIDAQYGWSEVAPVPADYDGDGKADKAVFHRKTGDWYIAPSGGGAQIKETLGVDSSVPVPADYDGDGKADLAAYHPADGAWSVKSSASGETSGGAFGWKAAVAVPADYDGDGKADKAVYHRAGAEWHTAPSGGGAQIKEAAGGREWTPVALHYQAYRLRVARRASRVIVLGDSVAFGAGASAAGLIYSALVRSNDDARWTSWQGKDLATKFLSYAGVPGSAVDYRNFAVGGSKSEDVLSTQLPSAGGGCLKKPGYDCYKGLLDVYPSPPAGETVVIMDIGGNDLLGSQWSGETPFYKSALTQTLVNVGKINNQLKSIFAGGVTLYLAAVYDVTDGKVFPPSPLLTFDGTVEYDVGTAKPGPPFSAALKTSDFYKQGLAIKPGIDAYHDAYQKLAPGAGIRFADIKAPFQGHAYYWQQLAPGGGWLFDAVHPNDQGHHALRGAFYPLIDADFDTL